MHAHTYHNLCMLLNWSVMSKLHGTLRICKFLRGDLSCRTTYLCLLAGTKTDCKGLSVQFWPHIKINATTTCRLHITLHVHACQVQLWGDYNNQSVTDMYKNASFVQTDATVFREVSRQTSLYTSRSHVSTHTKQSNNYNTSQAFLGGTIHSTVFVSRNTVQTPREVLTSSGHTRSRQVSHASLVASRWKYELWRETVTKGVEG